MHVEDLAALAEPADYIEDLVRRVVEHLGDHIWAGSPSSMRPKPPPASAAGARLE
jgi:hypothetical protein